jgi:hypothetical protein
LKKLSVALAIIGFTLGTLLVGWYGFGAIATVTLSVGKDGPPDLAIDRSAPPALSKATLGSNRRCHVSTP